MPSRCSVRVKEARDLPLMDRDMSGAEFTDAFVEVRFAGFEPRRTAVRRTQQPQWDEDFRFEIVDDSVLQSSPIEFKVRKSMRTATGEGGVTPANNTLARARDAVGDGPRRDHRRRYDRAGPRRLVPTFDADRPF
jgi:hypothetical protein